MKKLFISMLTLALVVSSCGDGSDDKKSDSSDDAKKTKKKGGNDSDKSSASNDSFLEKPTLTVCECIDGQVLMMKDILNGMSDEDAEAKYNEMEMKCKSLGEGKSDEELEALNKEALACPSAKEVEKLQQEVMSKIMQEEGFDMNDGDDGYDDEDYGDEDYGDEDYSIEGVEDAIEAAEGAYDDGGGNNI